MMACTLYQATLVLFQSIPSVDTHPAVAYSHGYPTRQADTQWMTTQNRSCGT